MKVAFVGDLHVTTDPPTMRLDDYCLSVCKKLAEILEWCRNHGVDCVVLLGDLFDKREPGGRARNMVTKVLLDHKKSGGCPIDLTVGNHDTSNDVNTLKRSTVWNLHQVGLLKITNYNPSTKVAYKHHHVHVDHEVATEGLHHPQALIWATHVSLYPNKFRNFVDFGAVDITGPVKLVVTGHIHASYKCKRPDGRILINPGNIGRDELNDKVAVQEVRFLVVEHDGETISDVFYVPVASALPYDQVFDLQRAEKRKKLQENMHGYVVQESLGEYESLTPNSIMQLARAKGDLAPETLEVISKYIGEAHAKL